MSQLSERPTALSLGSDLPAMSHMLLSAHERFVTTGEPSPQLRAVVRDSWQRSLTAGADPAGHRLPAVDLLDGELHAYRDAHPLAAVLPVIRRLLVADAIDSELLVAIADADGRLLWVEGEPRLRHRAEQMHFVEGARWQEQEIGTNAPGTSLKLGRPIQIFSAEHFSAAVQRWSCSAAPIRDPQTGRVLGVIDVTGGDHVATPQMLTLVRTAAAAAQAELQVHALRAAMTPRTRTGTGRPVSLRGKLCVLGGRGRLTGTGRDEPLSLRITETLLLLARHPSGLSAEQIAIELYERTPSLVTVRAEMTRLRRIIGADSLVSRPYRLTDPLATDVGELERLLDRGAHRRALEIYTGPVLPHSEAPGIVRIRDDIAAALRQAMLDQARADVLLAYARRYAPDDVVVWDHLRRRLPPSSPRRSQVENHLDRIDAEFGLS